MYYKPRWETAGVFKMGRLVMAKKKRFVRVYTDGAMSSNEIWVDTQTGVNYFYHASGYSGGLTVLLDREGKPVISAVPLPEDK